MAGGVTQNMKLRLAGAVVLTAVVTGCGSSSENKGASAQKWIGGTQVTTPEIQVGTLVALSDEQRQSGAWADGAAEQFAASQGGSVRIVSEESGVYEFFGLSNETLAAAFADAAGETEIRPNRYMKDLVSSSSGRWEMAAARSMEQVCPRGRDFGMPIEIELTSAPSLFRRGVMQLGASVSFQSKDPMKRAKSQLAIVLGPDHSAFASKELAGASVSIRPDLPGGYTVISVGVSADGKCGLAVFRFGVTVDGAFVGKSAARVFSSADRKQFKHLSVIKSEQAWTESKRGRGVKIAIVDSGVNYNHPDLRANILTNSSGQLVGRDFSNGDAFPMDDNSHGTHVAGLAASAVTGVAKEARIMPIKALDALGGGDIASLTAAIRFAVDNGAQIINASFGGEGASLDTMGAAIEYARKKGVLFVAAAGNGDDQGNGFNIDTQPLYPVSYPFSNILGVAATGLDGKLSVFSNFGVKSVGVAAPGGDRDEGGIQAAFYLPEKAPYVAMMGTSMATPVTAGVAALVLAEQPKLKPEAVKALLLRTGGVSSFLSGKVKSGRLIDALQAVKAAKSAKL